MIFEDTSREGHSFRPPPKVNPSVKPMVWNPFLVISAWQPILICRNSSTPIRGVVRQPMNICEWNIVPHLQHHSEQCRCIWRNRRVDSVKCWWAIFTSWSFFWVVKTRPRWRIFSIAVAFFLLCGGVFSPSRWCFTVCSPLNSGFCRERSFDCYPAFLIRCGTTLCSR